MSAIRGDVGGDQRSDRLPLRFVSLQAILLLTVSAVILFLISAGVAWWASYDVTAAQGKVELLVLGLFLALGTVVLARERTKAVLGSIAVGCGWVSGGLAFLLILGAGGILDAHAAAIMLLLPLGCYGLWWAYRSGHWPLAAITATFLAVGFAGLVLGAERSTWLGLATGSVVGLWILVRPRQSTWPIWYQLLSWLLLGLVVMSAGLYAFLVFTPVVPASLGGLAQWMSSRLVIWRDVLTIVGDYQFTGAGLGTSEMILSSYLYLLHVPYLNHVHNLFIQIALEQGIIGVVGFSCIVLAAGTAGILTTMTSSRYRTVAAASMTSLVALVVYGLFDSDLYAGWQLIFIFVPVGFNWILADQRIQPMYRERQRPSRVRPGDVLMGIAPLLLILGMWLRPETEAALYANLGAVAQAKAELSVYKWERWLIQDRVRRHHMKDLAPAIAYYRMALAEDPLNSTVHRRLGQIYLSLGDYASALRNLESARALAPEQRTIRQLLGEVYAVLGDSTKAAQLWQSVNDDQYQLEARLWWYRSLGAAEEARRVEQVLQQIRNDPEPIYTGN